MTISIKMTRHQTRLFLFPKPLLEIIYHSLVSHFPIKSCTRFFPFCFFSNIKDCDLFLLNYSSDESFKNETNDSIDSRSSTRTDYDQELQDMIQTIGELEKKLKIERSASVNLATKLELVLVFIY